MNLRGVPEDEADDVRALLDSHGIDYFETPPNHWGITAGAIWLGDDDRATEVSDLLAAYQEQRRQRALAERERQRREGAQETIGSHLRRRPLASLTYLLLIAGLIYLTVRPFFQFAG